MARWTDLAPWRGPTINEGDGDGVPLESADALTEVRGLVVHIAEGYFEGTIAWQKNPDANVSSHFVAGRAGGRAQMVDTHDRAWTQSAGNWRWLSVENEGFTLGHRYWQPGWHELTGAQCEFIAQLFARIHQVYGVPLQLTNHPDRPGLGYHSMGAEQGFNWGHSDCPGEPIKAQLPGILQRAIAIVNGDDMDDWGAYGQPASLQNRTDVVMTADVWGQEQWGVSPWDGKTPSRRTVQLNKIEEASNKLLAAAAADETRDAATLAAIQALASGGTSVDTAVIVERIKTESAATRALVEERHQVEMAALAEEKAAEIAGLRAELDRLTGATPA